MHEKRFDGSVDRLRSPERVERLEVERVVDQCLQGGPFASLLDVGTGSALFAEAFSRRGLKVSGVDANPEMLDAARAFVPEGDFREGTAEALPFPEASFDLVFLGLVLHEADQPLKALKEARRVARRQVSILEWPYEDGSFGPPLAHRLSLKELVELFQEAGYRNWKMVSLANTLLYQLDV
jgi:ubiquinone/menaquinone biosynthesis C-methylase UbiE